MFKNNFHIIFNTIVLRTHCFVSIKSSYSERRIATLRFCEKSVYANQIIEQVQRLGLLQKSQKRKEICLYGLFKQFAYILLHISKQAEAPICYI